MVQVIVTKTANDASANYIWNKLAAYSDMVWHPGVASSRNTGNISDGSSNMIGAERVIVNTSGKELAETVTKWPDSDKYYACSIDTGRPPFAKSMILTIRVREEHTKRNTRVVVDMIVDLELKAPFVLLTPLLKVAVSKQLGGFVEAIANLKEIQDAKDESNYDTHIAAPDSLKEEDEEDETESAYEC